MIKPSVIKNKLPTLNNINDVGQNNEDYNLTQKKKK